VEKQRAAIITGESLEQLPQPIASLKMTKLKQKIIEAEISCAQMDKLCGLGSNATSYMAKVGIHPRINNIGNTHMAFAKRYAEHLRCDPLDLVEDSPFDDVDTVKPTDDGVAMDIDLRYSTLLKALLNPRTLRVITGETI
jgi:hypothetical protein